MPSETTPKENSRDSLAGAGWQCQPGAAYTGRRPPRFSWLNPVPLWQSRNDRLVRLLDDPTDERRREWMKPLGHGSEPDLLVDRSRPDDSTAFFVLGDTGEGDESQNVVVAPMLSQADGVDFMFICSDVIYPAGGAAEYGPKFFEPYRQWDRPVYAIPGNHDWYDDCTGFMHWFCGAPDPPPRQRLSLSPKRLLRSVLWRHAPRSDPGELAAMAAGGPPLGQPASYFAIDIGPVLLVAIDTGIKGTVDRDQAAWLRRLSRESDKPKILLSGKPIYVDGKYRPGVIEGSKETVDSIVTAPEHRYVAAVGGDIHNYQRYPVRLEDGRTILYLVCGGSGAFMHATHEIENIDRALAGKVAEKDFRCYPLRGDSLSFYSRLYARKWLGRIKGARPIPADEAAAIIGARLGIAPTRDSAAATEITPEGKRSAEALMGLPGKKRGALHIPFSEWLDWNEAPLFKSFLRVDADADAIRLRCFSANGCAEREAAPRIEDELEWTASSARWIILR